MAYKNAHAHLETVQNLKQFSSLTQKMQNCSKYLHLRNWN